MAALGWAIAFTAAHGYWYLGGRLGLGDASRPLPGMPTSRLGWVFSVVVGVLFALGLAVPAALTWDVARWVPRRLLTLVMWVGSAILVARGGVGLLDDVIRDLGLSAGGLTGLSDAKVFGDAHPSAYTLFSTAVIDSYFLVGGVIFGRAARQPARGSGPPTTR